MKKYFYPDSIARAVLIFIINMGVMFLITFFVRGKFLIPDVIFQVIISFLNAVISILDKPVTDAKLLIDTIGEKDIYTWVVDDLDALNTKPFIFAEVVRAKMPKEAIETPTTVTDDEHEKQPL
jgi:hypothetical protein